MHVQTLPLPAVLGRRIAMDIPKARLLPRQGPGKNKGLALVGSTVCYGGILTVCVA